MDELRQYVKPKRGNKFQGLQQRNSSRLKSQKYYIQDGPQQTYAELCRAHQDFDAYFKKEFFRIPGRNEHISSSRRPLLVKDKILLPDDQEKVYHYHYPNDDLQTQALNYDVAAEYQKIDNKIERRRLIKKMNYQLSKILNFNEQYKQKKEIKKISNTQPLEQVIKFKNNKLDILQLKSNMFTRDSNNSLQPTQDSHRHISNISKTAVMKVGMRKIPLLPRSDSISPTLRIKMTSRSQLVTPTARVPLRVLD